MPLQNRVAPNGEIVATPQRGTMMGNRGGCFHRDDKSLKTRKWATRQWICCVLSFKERRRRLMQPGLYTELFFLDEATALAAGHRPCFECRRADATRFQSLWAATVGRGIVPRAADMDDVLHAERLSSSARGRKDLAAHLPDGTFVEVDAGPAVVVGDSVRPWSFAGYGPPMARPRAPVTVLTPLSIIAIMRAGYLPRLHTSVAEEGNSK